MREGSPNRSSTTNREVPRAAQLSPYPGHSSGKSLRLKILTIFSHVRSSQVRGDRDFSFSEVKKKIERIIQDEKLRPPQAPPGRRYVRRWRAASKSPMVPATPAFTDST